mmetsp:Transcript_4786/g.638  ORF Transcript_4786/g.638 Transcript_4786/m.638 type:complete len:81 (+) Transcript_4786:161-403(+)
MALRTEKKCLLKLSVALYIIGSILSVVLIAGSLRSATVVYCESGFLQGKCFDSITSIIPFSMKPWKAVLYIIGIYSLMPY